MRALDELADLVANYEEAVDEQVMYVTSDGERFSEESHAREYTKTVAVLDAYAFSKITIGEAKALIAAYSRQDID